MAWINGRVTERKQGDSIGLVSADWEVDSEVVFTYSALIDTSKTAQKNKYKTDANNAKDAYLARKSKEDALGAQITTFLNS
jgi:hypothetical protein